MQVQHESLFQALLANPHDDAVRWVYADWLEEQGQGERAELIRVQMQLATTAWDEEGHPKLLIREQQILREFGQSWQPEPQPGMTWGRFHRGWVDSVVVEDLQRLRTDAVQWFNLAPITRLEVPMSHLTSVSASELATMPVLNRFRELNLRVNQLGDSGVKALCRSPMISGLQVLDLSYNYLSSPALQYLGKCQFLGRLKVLNLQGNLISDLGLHTLANSRFLLHLSQLNLRGNQITLRGAKALLNSPNFPDLKYLDLTRNHLSTAEARSLRGQQPCEVVA